MTENMSTNTFVIYKTQNTTYTKFLNLKSVIMLEHMPGYQLYLRIYIKMTQTKQAYY
jgi:hypothetical protein